MDEIQAAVPKILEDVQREMFEAAQIKINDHRTEALNWTDFMKSILEGKVVLAPWCEVRKCEEEVLLKSKEEAKVAAEASTEDVSLTTSYPWLLMLGSLGRPVERRVFASPSSAGRSPRERSASTAEKPRRPCACSGGVIERPSGDRVFDIQYNLN